MTGAQTVAGGGAVAGNSPVNPLAGEVGIWLGGRRYRAKLTLGTLAELEEDLGERSMIALVERFESGRFGSRDVMAVLAAGLRGGGWQGCASDLPHADLRGGPIAAAQLAAQLLARAFQVPAP